MPKHTPLYEAHKALRARMTLAGDWEIPLCFSTVREEHDAVRQSAGLFDLSHMGKIELAGGGAVPLVARLAVGDLTRLPVGQGRYTLMCRPDGGVVGDLIAYRLEPDRFLFVVNSGSREKDLAWIAQVADEQVHPRDASDNIALLALQGPKAQDILQRAVAMRLGSIKRFAFTEASLWHDVPARVARTGYSGEDGFELFLDPEDAARTFERLLDEGEPDGLLPCGQAAREALRLEAGLPLYGHELTEDTNPLEAGLAWTVDLDTPRAFLGREAIARLKASGVTRKLVGLRMQSDRAPEPGDAVAFGGEEVGHVTSAGHSLSLEIPIAMAYVATPRALPGTTVQVLVDDAPPLRATVSALRFVQPAVHDSVLAPAADVGELSASEWLRRSEADLHAAASLLRSGDVEWSIVLSGQAVAKALKAAYAELLQPPPPTYDLFELFRGINLAIPAEWRDSVSLMQRHHRNAFHPKADVACTASEPQAQRAHLAATELCEWIRRAQSLAV